jgi:hypothetical protein
MSINKSKFLVLLLSRTEEENMVLIKHNRSLKVAVQGLDFMAPYGLDLSEF